MVADRLVAVVLFALGVGLSGPVVAPVAAHPAVAAVRQVATVAPAEVAPSTVDPPASPAPAPAVSWRNGAVPLVLALSGGLLATVLALRTTRRARRAQT
jgi:hypothetical protein